MNKIIIILIFIMMQSMQADHDPFESVNSITHELNQGLDKTFAVPIAKAYADITPDPIEKAISNFVANIEDINISANNILQGKFKSGFGDIARFLINSTIGIAGIFDVASDMGLEKHDEDFGQTLAVWGVPEGPYIVIPALGPSNLRDTLARIPDSFLTPLFLITHERTSYELTMVDMLETRARYLGLESLVIGDEYLFFKDSYFQNRNFEIYDGIVEDTFEDFEDFED